MNHFKSILFKFLFFLLSLYSVYYIFFVQTEKYVSQSTVMIRDLSQEQTTSMLGSLLLPNSSKAMKDAKLLEIYIQSLDMFTILDRDFNLTEYYKSQQIDFLHRLRDRAFLPNFRATKENVLYQYIQDLKIIYNDNSSTITIAFAHANAKIAKQLINKIIDQSGKTLNRFENENTKVVLKFLEQQTEQKHKLFIDSLQELLKYQNKNQTFNPKFDIDVKNKILADLESELIKKNVEYHNKIQYLNPEVPEMTLLQGNIDYIKKSIQKIKGEITGNRSQKELNANMSDFTLLENKMEFNKKLYIQTLIKLEETKVRINQNRKNLIIITKAEEPDSYTYPNKIKDSLSILIILTFLYGILRLILLIIKDHKD